MLAINIPGRGILEFENVVFDYNGTLAVDGQLSPVVKDMLLKLKDFLNVYILTADTYGTVQKACDGLDIHIKTFPRENAGLFKKNIVKELDTTKTLCVGNGFNDIQMLKESALSIAVIEKEGCSGKLLTVSDIVVTSIEDVFEMLLKPDRIKATLRN